MSRFYDALKRAGQSIPFGQEEMGPETFPSLTKDLRKVAGIPAVHKDGSNGQSDSLAAEKRVLVPGERNIAVSESAGKKGIVGAFLRTRFPRKTRVIPNIPDAAVLEQYRVLRTRLMQLQKKTMFKSLLITSPNPNEGKTVTTLNLALTFGLLPGFKVLVVEGDLRRGTLLDLLRMSAQSGFSDLIAGSASLEEVVLQPEDIPVSFIVRGKSLRSPGELLDSDRLPAIMHQLTEAFDLVLVDSPPVNLVTDSHLLANCCDSVLLVARAFATSCSALQEAHLALSPNKVLGTVLNGGTKLSSYYRYRSYY